ncbi:MAG: tRNA pseudouridine(38-40) synthase TruA [Candidatus Bathyarchaeia archaeon]
MARYAVKVFYDGTAYHGFFPQPDQRTIADEITQALQRSRLLRLPEGRFQAASRTDAGASALGQTIAFTTEETFTPMRLNAFLPADIRCWAFTERPEGFNPRREAISREYVYVAPYSGEDLSAMREAVALFKGTHDFHNFTRTQQSPCIKTLRQVSVKLRRGFLFFHFSSKSYGWGMIRKIVWTLLKVGMGRVTLEDVERMLQSSYVLKRGVPLTPSENLMLLDVKYKFPFNVDVDALRTAVESLEARVARATLLELSLRRLRQCSIGPP